MSEDWARLAHTVKEWRADKRLSQERIRANGGPSDVVISRIERNEAPHPRGDTLEKLDAGMEWRPGSSVSILGGGDPIPIARTVLTTPHVPTTATKDLVKLQSDLAHLVAEVSEEIQSRLEDFPEYGLRINPDAPPV